MVLSNYKEFLDRFFNQLKSLRIDISGLALDHIAYKVASDEEYDKLKPEFLKMGKFVREVLVGGRRVGVYKLKKPLVFKHYRINAVELIAPKRKEEVISGLEHAEFVLNESFQSFMKKYPNLDWDTSNVNRDKYRMLKLKLSDTMQVKFPEKSILSDLS